MGTSNPLKNAIILHREMYERRCREKAWFQGQSLREVIQRINTMRLGKKQPDKIPQNGQRESD